MNPPPPPVTASHGQIVNEGHDVFAALQNKHKYILLQKSEI